jgi:hypothetical protein
MNGNADGGIARSVLLVRCRGALQVALQKFDLKRLPARLAPEI